MAFSPRYLIVLLTFCVAGLAQAQTAPNTSQQRSLTVLGLQNAAADYKDLVLLNGSQQLELVIKPNARSAPLILKGASASLVIARRTQDPQTGQPINSPVTEVTWPNAGSRQALLIVGQIPGSQNLRGLILDDSGSAFPSESIRVLNLTGIPLLSRVSAFSGELKSGVPSSVIQYPDMSKLPPNSVARYPFGLAIRNSDGTTRTLSSGFFEARPGTRSLIVIQPPAAENSNKVRIKTIVDRVPNVLQSER